MFGVFHCEIGNNIERFVERVDSFFGEILFKMTLS